MRLLRGNVVERRPRRFPETLVVVPRLDRTAFAGDDCRPSSHNGSDCAASCEANSRIFQAATVNLHLIADTVEAVSF
jgi:hypothetical protein